MDGEPVGLYAIYSDITELQSQRRYYQALFDLSPAAIVTVDTDINVTSWNPAAERMFGYSAEEAIGRNADELVASDPDIREEAVAESTRSQRRRRRRPLHHAAQPQGRFARRRPRALRRDRRRRRAGRDLRRLPRHRRAAGGAARGRGRDRGEERLPRDDEPRDPHADERRDRHDRAAARVRELDAEQRGFAEVIRTSGEALLAVINDILDFSKIEAGRLDLEPPFDLRECVESALELVAPAAAEKALDLAYVLAPACPRRSSATPRGCARSC